MIRFAKDIKKYWRYMIYSARATLKDEVANSFLNWLWWILDPLLFMLVYTFVFTIVFGRSQDYLCAFIFIGYTTWTFFNRSILASVRTIKRYQGVLSKVYLPKFVLLISNMLVNGFKMLIGYGLIFVSMFIYRVPLTPKLLWMIPYLLLLALLSFGLSCQRGAAFAVPPDCVRTPRRAEGSPPGNDVESLQNVRLARSVGPAEHVQPGVPFTERVFQIAKIADSRLSDPHEELLKPPRRRP